MTTAAEAEFLKYNFVPVMTELERRCAAAGTRELNDLHAIFGDVDDGLFAFLAGRFFNGYDAVKETLPGWASDEIRHNSTGKFEFRQHVLDASWFWRTVRDEFEDLTGKPIASASVADYGAGWGRIARFANKDVPAQQFYALEPNPLFQKIYSDCRLPGHLVPTGWQSAQATGVENVDLIFSYSILTHSSEELTRNIVDRWTEMTRPGSVVACTIRPGCFLTEHDGDMAVFSGEEHGQLAEAYLRGEFIYKPYRPDEPSWGVTVIPVSYLERLTEGRFKLVKCAVQLQTTNQLIVFLQRL